MEYSFDFLVEQFAKSERDAHSVRKWLTGPPAEGGKGIPEPVVLEVMFEYAKRIEAGDRFGFNKEGLSQLSLAVYKESEKRRKLVDAEIGTKMLQVLSEQALTERRVDNLADDLYEMLGLLYEKVDALEDRKVRLKNYKRRQRKENSVWFMPLGKVWSKKVRRKSE